MNFIDIAYISTPNGNLENIHIDDEKVWERCHIYGISWAKSSSSVWTRTDDSANFSSPVIAIGTSSGSSSFDNCYPWNAIEKVTDGNNVLVKIPKFWYKWTNSSSSLKLQIADKPLPGYYVCPLCADRGDGKGERDFAYIGRYRCASSTYYSSSGKNPQRSMTRATARTKISSLGAGYYQFDYAAFWTTRMLYLVEFADWDTIAKLSPTSEFSTYSTIYSGSTDSMTYHTGIATNGYSVQYRYMEDLWSCCLEWCDGIYFASNKVYCINNPTKFSDSENGTHIGDKLLTTGFIKDWTFPTASGYEYALFPSATTSTSGYVCDGYYPESGTVMYIGGSRNAFDVHGGFFMYCDFTATSTSTSIGTRLMKLL